MTLICPYCSAHNDVDIPIVREEDLPGRIDECRTCEEWFIIEVGSEIFKSQTVNLSPLKRFPQTKI